MRRAIVLIAGLMLLAVMPTSAQSNQLELSDDSPFGILTLTKIEGRPTAITAVSFDSEISADIVAGFITLESTNNGPFSGGFEVALGGTSYDLGSFRTRECNAYFAHSGDTAQVNRRGPATGTTKIAVFQRPLIASLDPRYQQTSLSATNPALRIMASQTSQTATLDLATNVGQGGYLVFVSPAVYSANPTEVSWQDQLAQAVYGVEITITGEPRSQTLNVGNLRRGNCEIARVTNAATQLSFISSDTGLTDIIVIYIPFEDVD